MQTASHAALLAQLHQVEEALRVHARIRVVLEQEAQRLRTLLRQTQPVQVGMPRQTPTGEQRL